MTTSEPGPLSRRRVMLGAGAAAAALGAGMIGTAPASAAATPASPSDTSSSDTSSSGTGSSGTGPTAAGPDTDNTDQSARINGTPVTSTIASAPRSGYTYRTLSMFDFFPEFPTAQRAWTGAGGVYSQNVDSALWASVDVPAGARIRDIEWYVRNGSGAAVLAMGRLWAAGIPFLGFNATVLDLSLPTSGSVVATRGTVPAGGYGPYPSGTKLQVGLLTPSNGTVLINGCRVGFSDGVGAIGILSQPVRVYDSRTAGGRFAAGQTRTVTLPSSIVRPGVTGVVAVIRALQAADDGYLKVFPASSGLPGVSSVNYWPGPTIANQAIVGVSAARQIKIFSTKKTHVVIDVTGTVS